jgi:DNA-binding ferritin-like protein
MSSLNQSMNKSMPTQNDLNKITEIFFTLQLLNKIYHWNTTSYSRHMATDRFNENMQTITDKFMEVFIGRYKLKPMISKLELKDKYLSDDGIKDYFIKTKNNLQQLENIVSDSELLNIRDELLAEINQTLYLFELK